MLLLFSLACADPTHTRTADPGKPDTDTDADSDTDADTDTDTDADSDTDTDTDTDADTDTDTPPDACAPLAPTGVPDTDIAALEACVALGGVDIGAATFDIPRGLTLPPGARLTGSGGTLRMVTESTNFVLTVQGGNIVRDVRLDGNGTVWDVNAAVLHVTGSGSDISDLWIGDSTGGRSTLHLSGVYFIDPASTGNVVRDTEITGTFYGAIFVAGLDAGEVNQLERVHIHDTWCDGVTFAGYGELLDSTLSRSGVDCDNGPIPGASVYGLDNVDGALIQGNTMSEDCGHLIDLDSVQRFVIADNTLDAPGYQWDGWAPWCGGAAGIGMVDSSYNTVTGNVVTNNESRNRISVTGDPNGLFGRSAYADLPDGGSTAVAVWLAQRPGSPGATVGNTFSDNQFRSSCGSGCTGVGWFVSRGTGYDASGGWSASTTNYFTRNNPYGSDVGSVRCGGNWYAASSTCTDTVTDPDCNLDDAQHTYDWARNDGCYDW